MSYIVEQKINGRIYLYEAESYWDKEKKQARQRRRYLGVKDPKTGAPKTPRKGVTPKAVANFGEIWLMRKLAERTGLTEVLEKAFDDDGKKLFDLACYDALEEKGFHLYREWAESAWGVNGDLRTSQDISRLFANLDERSTKHFQNLWLRKHGKRKAVAFDITSISSYSDGMSDVEWGHNRDGEALPQINLGLAVNCESGIPVSYRTYPGSIPDVSVLKRLVAEFSTQCVLSEMILDRGFHSAANLRDLREAGVDVLVSVPFNAKHAKEALKTRKLSSSANAFVFNKRTLFHTSKKVMVADGKYDIHLFYDEERKAREVARFFNKVSLMEKTFDGALFDDSSELKIEMERFESGMSKYFKLSVAKGVASIERDVKKMDERVSRMGKMLLLSAKLGRTAEDVLASYYRRDLTEKFFDTLKNKMGNDRLRTSSDKTARSRVFVAMLGLIIHSALHAVWSKSNLKDRYSMTKVLAIMKPLKAVEQSNGKRILTEISKKQREIMKEFNLTPPVL